MDQKLTSDVLAEDQENQKPRIRLDKEPFVQGADTIIDKALARKGI